MPVQVTNEQRQVEVDVAWVRRVASRALRHLSLQAAGTFSITLLSVRRIQTLNRRFLRHDTPTDVLAFRYHGDGSVEPVPRQQRVVGEILIAPRQARRYAKEHGIAYQQELARYVIHGLLHWLGYEDRTAKQRAHMRAKEDELLAQCGQ